MPDSIRPVREPTERSVPVLPLSEQLRVAASMAAPEIRGLALMMAEEWQPEAERLEAEVERLRTIIADLIEGENPEEGTPQWYAVRNAKAALERP
jgi:hypothetical protein